MSIQDGIMRVKAGHVQCKNYPLPTLGNSGNIYGEKAIVLWLKIQFEDLNNFCGVKEKMNPQQLSELSKIIFFKYDILNVSEISLFVIKFKAGEFGQFYGVIDPLRITNAFCQFMRDRMIELNAEQRKQSGIQAEKNWTERQAISQQFLNQRLKNKKKKILNVKKKWLRMDLIR